MLIILLVLSALLFLKSTQATNEDLILDLTQQNTAFKHKEEQLLNTINIHENTIQQLQKPLNKPSEPVEESELNNQLNQLMKQLENSNQSKQTIYNQLSAKQHMVQQKEQEIINWQKEVDSLKEQLSHTDIQIRQLKNRFTVFEMQQSILFNLGQVKLKREGQQTLSNLAKILRQYPNRQISIQGHSDDQPLGPVLKQRYTSNWELAAARAASAIYYLQHIESIKPSRLTLVSHAQYRPKVESKQPQARSANRRIEIIMMPEGFDFLRQPYQQ